MKAAVSLTGGESMYPLRLRLIIGSVALGLWASAPLGWAGRAQGVAAYKQGDFATAVHEFVPLAQHGHAEAQFYLGAMYSKGWGVTQDDTAAAQWYRQAATQGLAEAQFNLGWIVYPRGGRAAGPRPSVSLARPGRHPFPVWREPRQGGARP